MGNDGGSIPKRRELVKSAARVPTVSELKATVLESQSYAWTHDPVTTERLDLENTVSDWRGRLYNYETILQGLLPTSEGDEAPQLASAEPGQAEEGLTFASTGIKSVRDIVKLKFKQSRATSGAKETTILTCPVSMKELGPATKSVYLVPCGHVFAEVAIKQIDEQVCPVCSDPFQSQDVIPILPIEKSELERLMARIDGLRVEGLTHSLKKEKGEKKKKKRKAEEDGTAAEKDEHTGKAASESRSEARNGLAKAEQPIDARLSGINNAFAASLTAKVLADQDERNKRRKMAAAR